jgi:hypothetical protein
MTYEAKVVRVLIASPGDLADDRDIAEQVVMRWNSVHSKDLGVVLMAMRWERDATPELGDRPQGIINRQIVDEADILLGLFWTRLGTPTGTAESGTAEEIEQFMQSGRPVLLLFSAAPIDPNKIDLEQYGRLGLFKNHIRERGLVDEYSTAEELRERADRHLTRIVRVLQRRTPAIDEAPGDPKPSLDLRVKELNDDLTAADARDQFLRSNAAVTAADAEVSKLGAILTTLASRLSTTRLTFSVQHDRTTIVVNTGAAAAVLGWRRQYSNTLNESQLKLRVVQGDVSLTGHRIRDPVTLEEATFSFDRNRDGENGWSRAVPDDVFYTSDQFAELVMSTLVDAIRRSELEKDNGPSIHFL